MITGRVANHSIGLAALVLAALLITGCPPQTTALKVTVVADQSVIETGDTTMIHATSTDSQDTTFSWEMSNEGVCTLSASKMEAGTEVEAIGFTPGLVVIKATGAHSGKSGEVTLTVTGLELGSHANRYTTYEGSKTCTCCHEGMAEEVHASVHYQWNGDAPDLIDAATGGKMTGMNGFCTYPAINFIGILTNLDGKAVSAGCAQCHVGMGAKPLPDATEAQLENIDCLICHSKEYRRKVVKREDGSFTFAPDEDKMKVPVLKAITDIQRTPDDTCLNCHAYAGGGQNNKRGDIEESHRNATRDFDVHMASVENGGAGLLCIDCHDVENHRIAGRGVDLRPTDLDTPVTCIKCHDTKPHASTRLNKHTGRVDCTACHIPEFSRGSSTEMYRDFSVPEVHPVKRLYEPELTRQQNVRPEYRFFDGTSFVYGQGEPATVDTFTGHITMANPLGDVTTAGAKLYPFKVHHAYQPIDNTTDILIPLKMGIYFTTANVDLAITTGASLTGLALTDGYDYVETQRYMGIFHEVAPAEDALNCGECHFGGNRIDFDALGYAPNAEYNNMPLCASCHDDYSSVWTSSELFSKVHEKHVDEWSFNCSACHTFTKAD